MIATAVDSALLALLERLKALDYRFTSVTPATQARVNRRPGNAWAEDLRGVFGWSRPFRQEWLAADLFQWLQQADALQPCPGGWRSRVRVANLGKHLMLHSAYPTEQADAVFFGPDSYRFVSAIEQHLQGRAGAIHRALDVGCGAGPGAIRIALSCPQAEVIGTDINPKALQLARINAACAGLDALQLQPSDLLHAVAGDFDLIVANPPYLLDPAERSYRHGGGSLGSGLSLQIIDAALPRLRPGGSLLLYTGVAMRDQHDPFIAARRELLQQGGWHWQYRELDPDLFGEELDSPAYAQVERIAAVLLEVTRPLA